MEGWIHHKASSFTDLRLHEKVAVVLDAYPLKHITLNGLEMVAALTPPRASHLPNLLEESRCSCNLIETDPRLIQRIQIFQVNRSF
jgi:hypothetical protein